MVLVVLDDCQRKLSKDGQSNRAKGTVRTKSLERERADSFGEDSAVMHLFSIGDEEVGRIRDGELTPRCNAEVGGKIFPFIIDSGAAANIV